MRERTGKPGAGGPDGGAAGRVAPRVAALAAAALLFGAQACTFAKVETIKPDALDAQRGQPMGFTVTGTGNCTLLRLDWGDSSSEDHADVDLGANPSGVRFSHTYGAFGGNKVVTARGVTNCNGAPQAAVRVMPPFALALTQPTAAACTPVPGVPALQAGQSIHLWTNPNAAATIDFGCAFGGCVHDADGAPGSVAGSDFPFPGLRKYSLVIRIGTQVAQGGTESFVSVNQSAPMEVCVNDGKLSDNTGGWGLFIDVHD